MQEDQTKVNNSTNPKVSTPIEEEIIPEEVSVEEENPDIAKDVMPEDSLLDKIKGLLSSKQMKSSKIATELGVSKKEINQVLYANNDVFVKDIFFNWKLKR